MLRVVICGLIWRVSQKLNFCERENPKVGNMNTRAIITQLYNVY